MKVEPNFTITPRVTNDFFNAIQARNPRLNQSEVEVLGNALLGQVTGTLRAGGQIAGVTPLPDGNVSLRVWYISERGKVQYE